MQEELEDITSNVDNVNSTWSFVQGSDNCDGWPHQAIIVPRRSDNRNIRDDVQILHYRHKQCSRHLVFGKRLRKEDSKLEWTRSLLFIITINVGKLEYRRGMCSYYLRVCTWRRPTHSLRGDELLHRGSPGQGLSPSTREPLSFCPPTSSNGILATSTCVPLENSQYNHASIYRRKPVLEPHVPWKRFLAELIFVYAIITSLRITWSTWS